MVRLRIAALLTGAALAFTLPALAQKGGTGPAPQAGPVAQGTPMQTVSALPGEVFGFRRAGDATDFEQRSPGLGASVEYRARLGTANAVATVYVYSGGQTGLPEGPDSPAVQAQMQSMGREVDAVARQRGNTLMSEASGPAIQGRAGRLVLRCNQYMVRTANGGQVDSYGCLGVVGGRFVKIRMTSANPSGPVNQAALVAFGRGIVMALGS